MKKFARKLKKALTKKLGPFPRWVWALAVVAGVLIVRARGGKVPGFGQQNANNNGYQSPNTPPDLAYEPGGMLPISPDNSSSGNNDTSGLLGLLAAILAQRNNPHGKRNHKKKQQHGRGPHGGHKGGKGHHHRPRSHAHKHDQPRGKPKSHNLKQAKGTPWSQHKHGKAPKQGNGRVYGQMASRDQLRNRPKAPMVDRQTQQTQRPVASHTPKRREPVVPAARPSAPPRRTIRKGR